MTTRTQKHWAEDISTRIVQKNSKRAQWNISLIYGNEVESTIRLYR